MHLLGINSVNMNATEFYNKCDLYNKGEGYGSDATLGFREQKDTSFPLTLIPRNIDEFVAQKYKIVFVLEKKTEEDKFQSVLMEVKKGLFEELFDDLPTEIKSVIDI